MTFKLTNIRRNLTRTQRHQLLADVAPLIIPQVELEMKKRQLTGLKQGQKPGFMSPASSMLIAKFTSTSADWFPVSLGYDRIRFIEPVFIGDTLTVAYTITAFDEARHRTTADILVTNQVGKNVALAQHILKWNTTTHDKPSDGAS